MEILNYYYFLILKMISNKILEQVSKDLNIPLEVVNTAYNSFWKFIRSKISELPLKEDLSKEEFSKLRSNFNIPSLGKMACTYERMQIIQQRYKRGKENGRLQKKNT